MATASDWRERVKEWKAGGMTAAEFCAERGLKAHQLKTWAWKLGMTAKKGAAPVDAPVRLVKLVPRSNAKTAVGGNANESSGIRIVAANVSVEVQRGFDRSVLVDVLAALDQRSGSQR